MVMSNRLDLACGIKFLPDRTGVISSLVILFIWLYGNVVVFLPIVIPHYQDGNVSLKFVIGYATLSLCTLSCYFQAMFSDPGMVPRVSTQKIDWRTWEKCVKCNIARPPRSHHCRKCGYCVLEMDHHCQWINNCVGKKNFRIFSLLLAYAFTFVVLNIVTYHLHKWDWLGTCFKCKEVSWIEPLQNPMKTVSYIVAVIAFTGITLLLMLTGVHITIGMTTIETMEDPKTAMTKSLENRRCIPRYDKLSQLCESGNILWWPIPCRQSFNNEERRTHVV